jgi:hypothetical protein
MGVYNNFKSPSVVSNADTGSEIVASFDVNNETHFFNATSGNNTNFGSENVLYEYVYINTKPYNVLLDIAANVLGVFGTQTANGAVDYNDQFIYGHTASIWIDGTFVDAAYSLMYNYLKVPVNNGTFPLGDFRFKHIMQHVLKVLPGQSVNIQIHFRIVERYIDKDVFELQQASLQIIQSKTS